MHFLATKKKKKKIVVSSSNRRKPQNTPHDVGLQASNPSELITMDQDYGEKMEFRRKTIASHPDTVVGAVQPDGLAPAQELYAYLLAEYLPTRYPSVFSLEDDGATLRNHVTGCVCPTAPPADVELLLRTLGETVEDDIFVLVRTPGGEHRMVAFVCCHPAGFDPAAKLGMVLAEIHGPVPSYEKIGPSMERFFAKLQVGEVVKRLNVSGLYWWTGLGRNVVSLAAWSTDAKADSGQSPPSRNSSPPAHIMSTRAMRSKRMRRLTLKRLVQERDSLASREKHPLPGPEKLTPLDICARLDSASSCNHFLGFPRPKRSSSPSSHTSTR